MVRRQQNRDWQNHILPYAAQIVADGGIDYTKRQLWYVLLSSGTIVLRLEEKPDGPYREFCRTSASWQRQGRMGRTIDHGRMVDQSLWFYDLEDGRNWLRERYRLDRTAGQSTCLMVGAEKDTMRLQLDGWFSDLGIARVILRGYTSQALIEDIKDHVAADGRHAVLIYAGDLDVDGFDIMADAVRRCGVSLIRVAINDADIPALDAFSIDAKRGADHERRVRFRNEHGGYDRAIEIEAMPPTDLRQRYQDAIDQFWDEDAYQRVLRREARDRRKL
jgi:hypothetical protein